MYIHTRVQLFAPAWTVAHQAPLCMGFPRQEYWSGLPCPPPGDLHGQGIKPVSLMSPVLPLKMCHRDFPGHLVLKTSPSGSISGWGVKISHGSWPKTPKHKTEAITN